MLLLTCTPVISAASRISVAFVLELMVTLLGLSAPIQLQSAAAEAPGYNGTYSGSTSLLVSRGPHLQAMSPTSVTIMWQPTVPSSTTTPRVYVGPTPFAFTRVFEGVMNADGGPGAVAVVRMTGLSASNKYYYTACSDTQCMQHSGCMWQEPLARPGLATSDPSLGGSTPTGHAAEGSSDVTAISSVGLKMWFKTSPSHTHPAHEQSPTASGLRQVPKPEQVQLRVLLLGDPGQPGSAFTRVLTAANVFMGARKPDMWVANGDNAYRTGAENEYTKVLSFLQQPLAHTPLWTTLGNHDTDSNSLLQTGPYFRAYSPPTAGEAGGVASGSAAYYSFNYGNVHVVSLDSFHSDRRPTGPMLQWLRRDLAALKSRRSPTKWLVAFWHHPVYSKGGHSSDGDRCSIGMREHALPLLEAAGLDLLLTGHSHSYERSQFVRGHWGPSTTFSPHEHVVQSGGGGGVLGGAPYTKPAGLTSNSGFVSVVSGASSKLEPVFLHGLNHPANVALPVLGEGQEALRGVEQMGATVIDFTCSTLTLTHVLHDGSVIDSFSMTKKMK